MPHKSVVFSAFRGWDPACPQRPQPWCLHLPPRWYRRRGLQWSTWDPTKFLTCRGYSRYLRKNYINDGDHDKNKIKNWFCLYSIFKHINTHTHIMQQNTKTQQNAKASVGGNRTMQFLLIGFKGGSFMALQVKWEALISGRMNQTHNKNLITISFLSFFSNCWRAFGLVVSLVEWLFCFPCEVKKTFFFKQRKGRRSWNLNQGWLYIFYWKKCYKNFLLLDR